MRWLFALLFMASPATALDCGTVEHGGQEYTACSFDASQADLRLFLNNPNDGKLLGSFRNVERLLAEDGLTLEFAMNAGMYHQDRSPVGHYLEKGEEARGVIISDGPGNFGLLPNGVFCIGDGFAAVVETRRYKDDPPACIYATQSGPMLVIDGELHPKFLEDSDSTYIRNGVGVSDDGKTVWFAISEEPVNFHSFGSLFRDKLGTPQALYFDGNISRLYVPGLNRHDGGFPMGPIVGVVAPADN